MSTELAVKKPNGSEAPTPSTPFELMADAIKHGISAEQLQILQQMHFKSLDREAETEFNEALARVQKQIPRVVPDLTNSQTNSKYASYASLDKVVRPVYSSEGFSVSFSTEDCPIEGYKRIVAYLRRGSHKEKYQIDLPHDGLGPKGNPVMTQTHANAAANTYGKRYLLCDIFNIPVGPDTDGNMNNGELAKALDAIYAADTIEKLKDVANAAYQAAKGSTDAQKAIIAAKDRRKKELSTPAQGVELEWGKK